MTEFNMPDEVRDVIKKVAKKNELVFETVTETESSIKVMLDVAPHREKDCKYACQIVFDWDIPLPGRLLCFVSIGIWNPPTPADSINISPFIGVDKSDEDCYHNVVLRFLSVPYEVSEIGRRNAEAFIARLLEELEGMNITFSTNHFDDDKNPSRVLPKSWSGLISQGDGFVQWGDLLSNNI